MIVGATISVRTGTTFWTVGAFGAAFGAAGGGGGGGGAAA